jgi:hypothetical protein
MFQQLALCLGISLCLALSCRAQSADSISEKVINLPSKLLTRLNARTANLDQGLSRQTANYLQHISRNEKQMRKKLWKVDSNAAKALFDSSRQRYASLAQKINTDSGHAGQAVTGAYTPYADSLQGVLSYLKQNPQLMGRQSPEMQVQLNAATGQFQALQAKMQDADEVKAYVQQRKQEIGEYIAQHAGIQPVLGSQLADVNKATYYYTQQLRQYKEMWNDPDELEQKALVLLNKLPAFQTFMKNNSQLGGLFSLPGNYGGPQALDGLQTRDQVSQLMQGQMPSSTTTPSAALAPNVESAESQLDTYKNKLGALGAGNGDMDMPDFKPNDQKTRTFLKRLEYGFNFQTTHDSYYFPTVTDLGLSLGYKLGHSNSAGIGASYKLGWGNGIQHIALSSQGVGLRSFLDIHLKGSFYFTGGFEYNYAVPFTSYQQLKQQQYWTKSGLIGISKTVSLRSNVLKKTSLQLLWDFLSYQQVPRTQPILFRVGYSFN